MEAVKDTIAVFCPQLVRVEVGGQYCHPLRRVSLADDIHDRSVYHSKHHDFSWLLSEVVYDYHRLGKQSLVSIDAVFRPICGRSADPANLLCGVHLDHLAV